MEEDIIKLTTEIRHLKKNDQKMSMRLKELEEQYKIATELLLDLINKNEKKEKN